MSGGGAARAGSGRWSGGQWTVDAGAAGGEGWKVRVWGGARSRAGGPRPWRWMGGGCGRGMAGRGGAGCRSGCGGWDGAVEGGAAGRRGVGSVHGAGVMGWRHRRCGGRCCWQGGWSISLSLVLRVGGEDGAGGRRPGHRQHLGGETVGSSPSQDGQSRTVRQFQFTDWPEQGVPKSGEGFIDFIGQVHKTKEQFGQDGPISVHCRCAAPRPCPPAGRGSQGRRRMTLSLGGPV